MRHEQERRRTSRIATALEQRARDTVSTAAARAAAASAATATAALLAATLLGSPALAAWEENGLAILSVAELLPALSAASGLGVRSEVPSDTPVLCDEDAINGSPKALAVALLQSNLRLDPVAGAIRTAQPTSERERATRRSIDASPVSVAASDPLAIRTGCVALFGRVIPAPYRVERVGQTIEVNGVAVYPARGETASEPRVTPAMQQEHDLLTAAMERFAARRGRPDEAAARAELLRDLLAIPGMSSAEWTPNGEVRLVRADGMEELLGFDEGRKADPDNAAAFIQTLDRHVDALRELLATDGTLLAGATYLVPVSEPAATILRPRIEAISRSNESEALRIARLQAYTLDRAAAADLAFAR